mmetsp:Transcript_65499/g.174496  ORF Transcript_65499/g.174496 Transcript_65499/m.174496 type:complete len:209 (+) Transcript_65499:405-1031(+)
MRASAHVPLKLLDQLHEACSVQGGRREALLEVALHLRELASDRRHVHEARLAAPGGARPQQVQQRVRELHGAPKVCAQRGLGLLGKGRGVPALESDRGVVHEHVKVAVLLGHDRREVGNGCAAGQVHQLVLDPQRGGRGSRVLLVAASDHHPDASIPELLCYVIPDALVRPRHHRQLWRSCAHGWCRCTGVCHGTRGTARKRRPHTSP